jgi:hypothetical protein
MSNLSVKVRLRPIRFAFVVRPEDRASVRKIFEVNTCLWGGLFNPIIPYFKRVPTWWERDGRPRSESAEQIINGYLDYFEPDFVVESVPGIASGFGIDPERILQVADLLPTSTEDEKRSHGQTVLDLYRHLYSKEFQFERRNKPKIVAARAARREFGDFVACLLGAFPTQENLAYFSRAFVDAFDPEHVSLDGPMLAEIYRSQTSTVSALQMGSSGLDIDYHDFGSPTLYILDANEPKDLVDFWNYRAVHRSGIPVPVQWLQQLSEFCKDFVLRNYRPLPGNPHGVMIRPVCLFSRSIPSKDIENLHNTYISVPKDGANLLQTWYPAMWRETPASAARRTRPTIAAAKKRVEVQIEVGDPHIRFETLAPDFAGRFGGDDRWANVVRLDDWSFKDRIATVFPTDFRVRAVPRFSYGERLVSTTEGLVHFPRFRDISNLWRLTEGKETIELWLKDRSINCVLSESGRATQQIIQTLDGFRGVGSIANKAIVMLLEEMARRPITRSAHHLEFENKIVAATKDDIWRRRVFETLVERGAVELGYELKCSKCGSWTWVSLEHLGATVTCDLCLQEFSFPLTRPGDSKHARWAYRVVGPFALPEYAKGGYAAALAIRFFAHVVGHFDRANATWSTGQELTLTTGEKVEADFILWYQRKQSFGTDHRTQVVFGEAKSFGKTAFKEDDVERMRLLAELHPGATLVFATLKEAEELSEEEIGRIKKIAEWGRERDKERRQTRAPVVMLTGTELFASHYLEEAWKQKGGKHAQLVGPTYIRLDNLRTLADATQQLYLGMPSYFEWSEKRWAARVQRRQQRVVPRG